MPGVEEVEGDTYRRTAVVNGAPGVVEVRASERRPAGRARTLLGLDADHERLEPALAADPLLAPLVAARPGLRVPGCWDGFELAVRAVLGQQVSVAAGRGLAARIALELGEALPRPRGSLTHLFPSAERLAATTLGGMPASRARAIAALAGAVAGGLEIDERADGDAVRAALLELPGIGPWTVEYVAMRALRDPDAFPAGDLVLRRALDTDERGAERRAEEWRPWRAYAAMHLWSAAAT